MVFSQIVLNFNSRPCERGDINQTIASIKQQISILAPARGATVILRADAVTREISILAPARGATSNRAGSYFNIVFQFSPLREGRPALFDGVDFPPGIISILAPARGATQYHNTQNLHLPISILAPARGATSFMVVHTILVDISILAPARGATRFRHLSFGI